MSLCKILYVSESKLNSNNANAIQVKSMCSAFVNNGYEVEVLCLTESIDNISGVKQIKGPEALLFYRIWILFKIVISYLKNKEILIYGRSYLIQSLLSIIGIQSFLELHTNEREVFLKNLLFHLSRKKKLIFIPISNPIIEHMKLQKFKFIVAHDGHSNSEKFKKIVRKKGDKLNVAYFGKLSERKGLKVLKHLDQLKHEDFKIHIFSPDKQKYNEFSNKVIIDYISHNKVYEYMKKMDVLLLPIQSVNYRDYSSFTSPLKLFEYASVGRLILLSDVQSLSDLKFPPGIFKCRSEKDWEETLNLIKKENIHLNNKILKKIHNWAQNYNWDSRVKKILNHDFN
jgi:glycosyltransferase involved in cell wall biosynthesis